MGNAGFYVALFGFTTARLESGPRVKGAGSPAAHPAHGLLGPGLLPPGQAPLTSVWLVRVGQPGYTYHMTENPETASALHAAPAPRPVGEAVSRPHPARGPG